MTDLTKAIHPRILEVYRTWRQRAASQPSAVTAPELYQWVRRRQFGLGGRIVGGIFGVEFGYILWALPMPVEHLIGIGLAGVGFATLIDLARFLIAGRRIDTSLLRFVLPGLSLSTTEKAYCVSVIAANETALLSGETKDEIVRQLYGLLDGYYSVEDQRTRLSASLGDETAPQILEEKQRLEQKLSRTSDTAARKALERSIELCDERIIRRAATEPLVQRLDAQAEVIAQTLRSTQEALSRLSGAPAEISLPDPVGISQSMAEINEQTRAVEAAVQEVMRIGASV